MHIKKDDTVVVISGKDKGKKGKVLKAIPDSEKVIVEGINIQTKHQKQTRKVQSSIMHQEGPVHVSNVMLWDNKAKAPTRIGYEIEGKGKDRKKYRVSKKTGQRID